MMPDLAELVASGLADPEATWSLGTFGAIAEFLRTPSEPAEIDLSGPLTVATARGAIRIATLAGVRAVAYEQPTAGIDGWSHAVAFCVARRETAGGRAGAAELGPDRDAVREADRDGILFDLGLGAHGAEVCVRAADDAQAAALRRALARGGDAPSAAIREFGPARVFRCRFARIEVHGPVPPPRGKTPDGPHTHVLPSILKLGRAHAATAPIPEGWVPLLHLHPPHPLHDPLGRTTPFARRPFDAFAAVLRRLGDPALLAAKDTVKDAVRRGLRPGAVTLPDDRHARAAVRVALRQMLAVDGRSATLDAWRAAFDRSSLRAG